MVAFFFLRVILPALFLYLLFLQRLMQVQTSSWACEPSMAVGERTFSDTKVRRGTVTRTPGVMGNL